MGFGAALPSCKNPVYNNRSVTFENGNRLLYERRVQHEMEMHKKKIRNVKSTVYCNSKRQMDNSAPKPRLHVFTNLKRQVQEDDRDATVERENTLLLEKMSKIMLSGSGNSMREREWRPGTRLTRTMYPVLDHYNSQSSTKNSLNALNRQKDIHRIMHDNERLLDRLERTAPFYDHRTWDKERLVTEARLRRLAFFPSKDGNRNRPRTTPNLRRSTAGFSTVGNVRSAVIQSRRTEPRRPNTTPSLLAGRRPLQARETVQSHDDQIKNNFDCFVGDGTGAFEHHLEGFEQLDQSSSIQADQFDTSMTSPLGMDSSLLATRERLLSDDEKMSDEVANNQAKPEPAEPPEAVAAQD